MDAQSQAALDRLLILAQSDTGQSRRVANFLLAWWNAEELGGFDLADLFAVDLAIAQDMTTIFVFLARGHSAYPEHRRVEIERLIKVWRPAIWAKIADPEFASG
jgi:hypothetical protein